MNAQLGLFDDFGRVAASGDRTLELAWETLELPDGDIRYARSFLLPQQRGEWFQRLFETTPWKRDQIIMYGRKLEVPRLSSWHGDPATGYAYSNIQLAPIPWTVALSELKTLTEAAVGASFNSVLVNLYRDGSDSVAWHADDEPELGAEPLIASVSLGATRRFQLRHRSDSALRRALDFADGSIVVMQGLTQQCWLHQITKTARPVGPRINLTFRTVAT